MYQFWLGEILLPISPSKITISTGSQNETLTLVDGSEINIVRGPKLRVISFEALIPYNNYPFASYLYGYKDGDYYREKIEELKNAGNVFQFVITRKRGRNISHYTDIKCVVEEIGVTEASENGFDIILSIKLREYKNFGAKFITSLGSTQTPRQENNAPKAEKSYTVLKGDSLWSIAKKHYGDGSKWKTIYNANTSVISNPNVIKPGTKIVIP